MSLGASPAAPPRVRLHALKAEDSSPTPVHCCQHLRPQGALRLCVAAARYGNAHPPQRVSHAHGVAATRGVLVRQHPSRMNAPLALHVTLPSRLAEAGHSENAEDPSSRGAPTPRGCEPGAPSIDLSTDSATSKLAAPPMAATAPAAWPRQCSFRPGFHAHAVRARPPSGAPLFAARPREEAPCRWSTSAIEMIREHTRGPPKLRHSCGGMPPLVGR